MTSLNFLAGSIETRLAESRREIAVLEAALHALTADATPATTTRLVGRVTTTSAKQAGAPRRRRGRAPQSSNASAPAPVQVDPVTTDHETVSPEPAPAAPSPTTAVRSRSAGKPKPAAAKLAASAKPAETPAMPALKGEPLPRAVESSPLAITTARAPRRRSMDLAEGTIEALLTRFPQGLSGTAITKRTGASGGKIIGRLRELEKAGTVRSSGSRRTSLWRLVTDDELIAERTAELEKVAAAKG
jgi:hypothetical protein